MYGIVSEKQIIDKQTIINACNKLKSVAGDFSICGDYVENAGKLCTSDVISVEGQTFEEGIVNLGKAIKDVEKDIIEMADKIINVVNEVYSKQVSELKEYKKKQEELEKEKNKKK